MKIGWLIDGDMFHGYREELIGCIHAQGHEAKLAYAPQPPYRWDDIGCSYRESFAEDACVVALGDIELVTRVHHERRWVPGVFASIENFTCSAYFCGLGKYLLNREYLMLPFGELSRQRDFLFSVLGQDGRIFVRPDSPLKLFTGQVVTDATFDADLEFMAFYEFPPSSLVVVSSPKQIQVEWRFVVANRKVVTGCQYRAGDNRQPQRVCDPRASDLASEIAAQHFQPDPVWIIDICKTEDQAFHLLEIGGFSFADLYACDKKLVVEAVSTAAIDAWNRAR
jgi:hypothetical protein